MEPDNSVMNLEARGMPSTLTSVGGMVRLIAHVFQSLNLQSYSTYTVVRPAELTDFV